MKRGGVGACFKVCQQPWILEDRAGHHAERTFPARQLSRLADVPAYLAAGVAVLKLQGRSLPADTLGGLIARYREALDRAATGRPQEPGPAPELSPTWTVVGR
jgi:collagenase-like PrtC family protease